jgi:tetratricopeptide (TPR) repeat protein
MEQALRYFQQAADLDPHDALSQNLAATALEETRRFDEALRYYQRALEARPTDVEAMHGVDRIRKRSHDSLHGRPEQ